MTEHYTFEKNRITCPAKIRTSDYDLDKDRFNRDGSARKIIRLANSQSVGTLESSVRLQPTHPKNTCLTNSVATPLASRNIRTTEDPQWMKSSFNKNNFLSDSWMKIQNSDIASRISKDQLTKRSDFGDFGDLERNITFHNLRHCDSSFEEPVKVLSQSHYNPSPKDRNEITRQNTFLQRTIEEKNQEINIILNNVNEERRSLESKITDLEFQNANLKRSTDKTIDSLSFSIKNLERVTQLQQNQIKRLSQQLFLCFQERRSIQENYQFKQMQSFNIINSLQCSISQLRNQLEELFNSFSSQKKQNNVLKDIIEAIQEEKSQLYKQFEEFRINSTRKELERQQTVIQCKSRRETQTQTEVEIDDLIKISVIQNPESEFKTIEQFVIQPSETQHLSKTEVELIHAHHHLCETINTKQHQTIQIMKKKLSERKAYINTLENQMKILQQNFRSADATNYTLAQVNQQIVSLSLRHLSQRFQEVDFN